jgi:hypothetical protein
MAGLQFPRSLRSPGFTALLLVASFSVLVGCAVDLVSSKDTKAFIPDQSPRVSVGQMGRTAVRAELGQPLRSSAYWGFDLFRTETEQSDTVIALTPWPIPFARIRDKLQRYTLVVYDRNDRAGAVVSGIFRRPAAWRNATPIESDFLALHLRADDLMFFVDPEGARQENLLVARGTRDAFFHRAASTSACTVVLGCGDRGCGDQLTIDAKPPRRLPLRIAHVHWLGAVEQEAWLEGIEVAADRSKMPWIEALVAVRLAPGEHVLEFSAKYLDGRHAERFACRPNSVSYWVVTASDNGSFMHQALVDWQVERVDTMPARFSRRPLVLMDDGQWYVEPEPFEQEAADEDAKARHSTR